MTGRALGPCAICGRPARELHHPTGRDAEGRYLDPRWTVPVCLSCHRQDMPLWRDFGLDVLTDPVIARLGRNTFFLGRLTLSGRGLDPEPAVGLHSSLVAAWQAARVGAPR